MSKMRWLVPALLLAGGCATPVGVTTLGRNYGYEQIDRCALNSATFSSHTANVLHRYDLARLYKTSPTRALIELHGRACNDSRRDALFALAEMAYLQGKRGRSSTVDGRRLTSRNYFAAAVVYAYLFLNSGDPGATANFFDRRYRIASDLYNRGLGYSVTLRDAPVSGSEHVIELPVGRILMRNGHTDFPKPLSSYKTVISADRFKIHGLTVRNRGAGMGSPIILVDEAPSKSPVPANSSATVFIRVLGGLRDMQAGVTCELDLYSPAVSDAVTVNGVRIPLEVDMTTPIAYALNNPLYWQLDLALFRLGQAAFEPGIYPGGPYQPGKIPVLWVHGTMSSPVWWSEMWNTLQGDPVLNKRYQHWFFLYNSAKPIMQSADQLRQALTENVRRLDPEGRDPALRQMVVIGHSQGGLLTKATAVTTGDVLIRAATGKGIAELGLSPEDEKLVRAHTELTPLPEVKRVVFLSTPHRGSFLAGGFARRLGKRFIRLPQQAVQTTAEFMRLVPKVGADVRLATTSLDSMAPDNPAMLALAEVPVRSPVHAHSIIAIKGDEQPPEGDDGVVRYTSAHIEGVDSEMVVRSGHSCQGHPQTIEEVRRILLVHLSAWDGSKTVDSPSAEAKNP